MVNLVVSFLFFQYILGFDIRINDKKYVWSPTSFAFIESRIYYRTRKIKRLRKKHGR